MKKPRFYWQTTEHILHVLQEAIDDKAIVEHDGSKIYITTRDSVITTFGIEKTLNDPKLKDKFLEFLRSQQ